MRCWGTSARLRTPIAPSSSRTSVHRTEGSGWTWSVNGTPTGSGRSSRIPATICIPTPPTSLGGSSCTALARASWDRSTNSPSPSEGCWPLKACSRWPRPRSSWARNGGATSGSTTAPTTARGARRTSRACGWPPRRSARRSDVIGTRRPCGSVRISSVPWSSRVPRWSTSTGRMNRRHRSTSARRSSSSSGTRRRSSMPTTICGPR